MGRHVKPSPQRWGWNWVLKNMRTWGEWGQAEGAALTKAGGSVNVGGGGERRADRGQGLTGSPPPRAPVPFQGSPQQPRWRPHRAPGPTALLAVAVIDPCAALFSGSVAEWDVTVNATGVSVAGIVLPTQFAFYLRWVGQGSTKTLTDTEKEIVRKSHTRKNERRIIFLKETNVLKL